MRGADRGSRYVSLFRVSYTLIKINQNYLESSKALKCPLSHSSTAARSHRIRERRSLECSWRGANSMSRAVPHPVTRPASASASLPRRHLAVSKLP